MLEAMNRFTEPAEEPNRKWLSTFEQKILDDLALALIDGKEGNEAEIERQTIEAAKRLGCQPHQAAIAASINAVGILCITPRHQGFFGPDDLYFDLEFAQETLRQNRIEFGRPRPASWVKRIKGRFLRARRKRTAINR